MKSKNLIVLSLLATLLVCTAFVSFANAADDTVISSAMAPDVPPDASDGEPFTEPLRPDEPIHEDMDTTFSAIGEPEEGTQTSGVDEPNLISKYTVGTDSVTSQASDPVTGYPSDSPKPIRPPSETTETDETANTELPIHPDMDIAYTAQNEDATISTNDDKAAGGQEVNLISARTDVGADNIWAILGIMAVLTAGLSSVFGVVLYRRVPIKK